MKKSLIFKSLIVLFSIISFVSCETEPLDPALDLNDFQNPLNPNNPNNQIGNFTASIDGVAFNSDQTMGDYSDSSLGNELNISGITSQGKTISIQIINPSLGTFQANTTASNLVLFQYSDATLGSNGFFSSSNSSDNTSTGSITITEFNTTTNKISATFSFTAYNLIDSTITKQVTQGVINNVSFDNQVTVTPPPSEIVGYMNANVNGVQYNQMKPAYYTVTGLKVGVQISNTGSEEFRYLKIQGNSDPFFTTTSGVEINLFLSEDYWQTGTYVLKSEHEINNSEPDSYPYVNLIIMESSPVVYENEINGSITITEFNSVTKRIKGTFNFSYMTTTDSMTYLGPFNVSNGEFEFSLEDEVFD